MHITKKIKILIAALAFALAISSVSVPCQAKPKTTGINVEYHSKKQIKNFVKKHKFNLSNKISYSKKPSLNPSSYNAGTLKKPSLKNGLNALNTMRYIAGIPANVKLDGNYNKKCQAASLVNAANRTLSHSPSKPSGMSNSLYSLGKQGAGSSNIAWASWDTNLAYSVVNQWMEDDDAYNIDRVGHRRWILNPSMKKTGFGYVNGYSAMYAFDGSHGETSNYGVAWPAQNMPVEYFSNTSPWSVSMGEYVDPSKAKVVLTRKKDGKKWTFSKKKSNGYFNVENSNYGQNGCIIFRPKNITYKAGDVFKVKITGLKETVFYEVQFFKL